MSKVIIEKPNTTDNNNEKIVADKGLPVAQAKQLREEDILVLFDEYGVPECDYRIIKQKRLRFNEDVEGEEDFASSWYADFEFAEALNITIDTTQQKVLSVIKENPKLSTVEIAEVAKLTPDEVNSALQYLQDEGVIKVSDKDGTITITDRGLKTIDEKDIIRTEIFVKYKYDGPLDNKNRPFCHQVLTKARLYTRDDIDKMGDIAGYNIWMQRGGWYHNPDGVNTPYCRHFWNQVIVKKKTRL